MKFYRGLSVASTECEVVLRQIREKGIVSNIWNWRTEHFRPDGGLIKKINLSLDDTRPKEISGVPAACACGDLEGALYYAWRHSRPTERCPVIVEFESPIHNVAIDGKDFLYTIFQFGVPEKAAPVIRDIYGERGLMYAELAWKKCDTRARIAICDLMIHDSEVIQAHHANKNAIKGRYGILFCSAFTVEIPILPDNIIDVYEAFSPPNEPDKLICLMDLISLPSFGS